MTDMNTAVFIATIPPIMTGIKAGADGMRFQMDVAETEMGEAVKLIGMKGKQLKVTVQVVQAEGGKVYGGRLK
jgi:hypothetical protein